MLEIPIFHVNGDDPDASASADRDRLDYRMKFHKDVVVDLGVLPAARPQRAGRADGRRSRSCTKTIAKLPTTRKLYADRLAQAA
jgi:2-oxoglutarate dehydrogenase E1 component